MFGRLSDLDLDVAFVVRGVLVVFATLALAPAAMLALIALAFVLSPIAIVGIPFIVPALFPGANREHAEAVLRASWRPLPEQAYSH